MCSSKIGLFSGGRSDRYIRSIIVPAAAQPHFTNLFRISVRPENRSPSINNQSTKTTPARPLKIEANGPRTAPDRKPEVGEPPAIHALPASVPIPKPKVLSKNAHKKTKPRTQRRATNAILRLFIIILYNFKKKFPS